MGILEEILLQQDQALKDVTLCGFTGSILGPVLFNIFLNDLNTELEGILSKFADDTKLGGAVDSLKGREALQRDLEKSEDWAMTNHVKFHKGKCRILHLGWDNPGCSYRLENENEMLESSAVERNLGVLVDDKLNLSQQCPGSQGRPAVSWGASGKAPSASQGRGLSFSALHWSGLALNIVCRFEHCNIGNILSYWGVTKGGKGRS
ncbi:rna-directed dna polymerase from mobile element jockey-like [Willisornis vidua]|uniref:Rna-directed dna polymerase from mobile element jockey-like n=1 Tax=Willisornis vidua TaxID=1566151 RepID=A0ABQ9CKF3_9PASS|nr:rna-directed dna polymerase from mobile element jockey-like [Willisornis vidua]